MALPIRQNRLSLWALREAGVPGDQPVQQLRVALRQAVDDIDEPMHLKIAAAMLKRFEWSFFAFLGRISYSAYLFHFAVLDVLATFLPHGTGFGNFIVGVVCVGLGTVAVAWTSSRTLEAWSVDLGRYIVKRLDLSAPERKAA